MGATSSPVGTDQVARKHVRVRRALLITAATVATIAVVFAIFQFSPSPRPRAVQSIQLTDKMAESAFAALIASDLADQSLFAECRARRVDPPGDPVGVVVLFHGYTSCPNQFTGMANRLADAGYTVLLPRMAGHGLAGRIIEEGLVDLDEFAAWGHSMLDIASAMNKTVIIGGLSAGATLALWLAEERDDIDRVVAIAPMLNPLLVPSPVTSAAANLLNVVPSIPIWWDAGLRERAQVPRYSYAQFQTRSLGAVVTMGMAVSDDDDGTRGEVALIINPNDESVDNDRILQLAVRERADGANVTVYTIPASLGAGHEYIDPGNPENRAAQTVPGLVELLTTGSTTSLGERS